jgi:hypothetical protein
MLCLSWVVWEIEMGTAAIIRISATEDGSKVWSEHIGMTMDGFPSIIAEIVERADAKFQSLDMDKIDGAAVAKILREVCSEYNSTFTNNVGGIFVCRDYAWITNFACYNPFTRYLEVEDRSGRIKYQKTFMPSESLAM